MTTWTLSWTASWWIPHRRYLSFPPGEENIPHEHKQPEPQQNQTWSWLRGAHSFLPLKRMQELTEQFKPPFLLILIILSIQIRLFSLDISPATHRSGDRSVDTWGLTTLPSHLKNYRYRKGTVSDRSYNSHNISTSISIAKARSIPNFANVKCTGFTSVNSIRDSRKNIFKRTVACIECHIQISRTYIFTVWFYPCKHVAGGRKKKNWLQWLCIT